MKQTVAKPAMTVDWIGLLHEAVNVPGMLHDAYRALHHFSLGNQMLAAMQLRSRGLPLNPVATFQQWLAKGRAVRKGEKAISLIRPIVVKKRQAENESAGEEGSDTRTVFVPKPHWFSLDQTDGEPFAQEPFSSNWDPVQAMQKLGIERVPFNNIDGNCMGWAVPRERKVSVSELAPFPQKTLIHEIAHCLLHADVDETFIDGSELSKSLKEVEAETTAYLVGGALGMSGGEYCRGYIQAYLAGGGRDAIPEANAKRIIRCATQILDAGMPAKQGKEDSAA